MFLDVRDLTITLKTGEEIAKDISFSIDGGEMLSIVGSSGAGKTTVCKAVMGLLSSNYSISGEVLYRGENLLHCSKKRLQAIYGKEICYIMQNPMTAFNPSLRIGRQLEKTCYLHNPQISRQELQLLLQLLLKQTDEHHYATGADILRFWETHGIQTTRKNVYSDIQLLMDFGLDVICIKSTQNRYFVGSRLLELPELKLLVDAVESSHLITEKKSTALIEKLGHLTSRHNAALLNRPVYMDGTAKPDNEAVYYAIDAIQTAIHKQRAISFQYFEYTPKKEKVLKHKGYRYGFSPYVLIWSRDFYYAVGWSEKHGKLAQFRVDRMTAIQDSDAPYIADPSFDPASYIREIFGMYHDMPQRVTLLCENRTMRNIIDHFGEDVDTEVVDANHFRATVDVAPTPPFFSWVFTFGGAIRIEGPGEALAKMRDMASWLHK